MIDRARLRSALLSGLVVLIALLVSAEFFSFLFVRYVVRLDWAPAYLAGHSDTVRIGEWAVPTAEWGPWRLPNASARHEGACFSVAMQSNSYGARDRERTREGNGKRRVVVLGDSFAEGWGVEREQRVSDLLEQRLGIEFLNFAMPMFGPLQYQMIYDRLAAGFAHDEVLIMLLPANDFTDNDLDFGRQRRTDEFRQRAQRYYFKRENGGYDIIDPSSEAGSARVVGLDALRLPRSWLGEIEKTIRANLWLHAAIGHVKSVFGWDRTYSGYYDFTPAQLDAVLWSLRQIKQRAGARPVTIVVLPRLNDFIRARKSGPNRLTPALTEFGRRTGIDVIDLLPLMAVREPDNTRMFIPCDGHWNAHGHQVAAEVLLRVHRFGQPE